MFEIIFLIALSIYFVQTVLIMIGAKRKYPKLADSDLPSISIVVAARNEESNIINCLQSLDGLDYPDDRIEIVIVDDNSEDETYNLIDKFIDGKKKFIVLKTNEQIGELKGKTNAIANALKQAKGEIILTTDADCRVSTTWARTLASYYVDGAVAMVCGYTNQNEKTNFEAMQSVDFIYVLGIGAGTMNLGFYLSCIGNNMSYRRSVYDEVGGYESIPFSITEDSMLLKVFADQKKYKIFFPLDQGGLVTSKPCENIKSVYSQKKRWGVGGLDTARSGAGILASGFVNHLFMVLTPFFFSPVVIIFVLFKVMIDYNFLIFLYKNLNLKLKFIHFLTFQLYFIIYVIVLPFVLFTNRDVTWKGRNYSNKKS
jgi:cellulose synthase/poly-beta-1,6-N-acetylglucosamine synthase-like glycosyltransferase